MATVVMFHSALGLRPAVCRFAEVLRGDGHEVATPDLFDGAVFDDLAAGTEARDEIGIPELVRRASQAVDDLPPGLVHVGFSMGAMPALLFAATRPGARGGLLIQGAAPLAALGVDTWPRGVRLQVHTTSEDPWVDRAAVTALQASVPGDLWEHHEYRGDGHLVSDEDWGDYDPQAAQAISNRVRAWLLRAAPDRGGDWSGSRRSQ